MKRKLTLLTACVLLVSMLAAGCGEKKAVVEKTGETVTVFAGFSYAEPGKADVAFLEKVEEGTGVKLEFDIPPSSSYAERLNILLASGDYPDVIQFNDLNSQAFSNAVEQGIIVPINEYLENAPSIKKYTYDYSWDAMRVGKDRKDIYGIPRSSLTRNDGYIVRKDWLEKVGLKIPEDHGVDIELFEEILKRFSEDDPDGNGKKDTYGTVAYMGANKNVLPIAISAFDCHGWQEYDNEPYKYMNPVYSKVNDNYKKALEFSQKAYKVGYIDPASLSYSWQDTFDKFTTQCTVGVLRAFAGDLLMYEKQLKRTNPDAGVEFFFLKNADGEIVGTGTADANGGDTGFWGHWCITSSAKNPAAAVKVFDWMLSDDGWDYTMKGVEGVEYNMVDGVWTDADKDDYAKWRGSFVRRAADEEYFASTYSLPKENRERVLGMMKIAVDTVKPTVCRGYVPEASKRIGYINYSKTMDETVSKILVGNLPVSEYDKVLDEWYKNGGDEYVKQMNDYIKSLENID